MSVIDVSFEKAAQRMLASLSSHGQCKPLIASPTCRARAHSEPERAARTRVSGSRLRKMARFRASHASLSVCATNSISLTALSYLPALHSPSLTSSLACKDILAAHRNGAAHCWVLDQHKALSLQTCDAEEGWRAMVRIDRCAPGITLQPKGTLQAVWCMSAPSKSLERYQKVDPGR